jgi:hypothetical protein
MTNVRKKTVVVEDPTIIDNLIEFMRSKSGHALVIVVMGVLLTVLTSMLFADVMREIRGWQVFGILIGVLFALGLESGIFFLAINGYNTASLICAAFSVVIARATFAQMFDSSEVSLFLWESWTPIYMATWVMSLFPPLVVAFVSHKLNGKFELEEKARLVLAGMEGKGGRPERGEPSETVVKHDCQSCGSEFLGDPKAIHCSDKCKQKAYRERKKQPGHDEAR